jgi:glutamine synthetase adenylyltransferase
MTEMLETVRAARWTKTPDLKYSPGGLVDIEFTIQYLQLTGRASRTTNTADAIESNTVLDEATTARWLNDYFWLRRVEALVRMSEMSETSELPTDALGLESLARRCGFTGTSAASQLEAEFEATTERCKLLVPRLLA